MLYRLIAGAARIALRWYYREIQVVGAERVPLDLPLLVVANHPNALMDPMLVATSLPRRVTFTGKATLFDKPLLPLFLRALGFVPLRRASDEAARRAAGGAPDPGRNADAFRAIVAALADRRAVLIFPEGKSHDEPQMSPLRTGAARMALQAREAGITDLAILPVGLVFEDKAEPRTRVLVEIGEPLRMRDWRPTADAGRPAEALTAEIDRRLRGVTINFPSSDHARDVLGVSALLADTGGGRSSLGSDGAYADAVALSRRVDEVRRALGSGSPALLARAEAVRARIAAIQALAAREGVDPAEAGLDLGTRSALWFVIRETCIAAIAGPLALWGRITHWVPLRVARLIARRGSRSQADPAMYTIVAGLALVLALYAASFALVWRLAGPWWALAFLVSLPVSAGWDFRWRDRTARVRRRARNYLRFRRDPALHRELAAQLAAARDEAVALEAAVIGPAGARSREAGPLAPA